MLETHISVVINGSDHSRWDAWAFVDDDEDELDREALFEYGLYLDPIASCDSNLLVRDANLPIWDAKDYFLTILEGRIATVLKWWEYLVQAIEHSIKEYVSAP
jgi:hypothetical protein